jgi:hypothetical protein
VKEEKNFVKQMPSKNEREQHTANKDKLDGKRGTCLEGSQRGGFNRD